MIVDTKQIQLASLVAFANALDYRLTKDFNFVSDSLKNKHRRIVSLSTFARWHNNEFLDWHGKSYRDEWDVPHEDFFKAVSSKFVWNVKLQLNKKTKEILVQSSVVAFLNSNYENLFFGVENNDE